MLDRTPLSERARGKWRDILTSLGVPASVINGKSQGCPFCGSSGPRSDRFTFDDKSEGDWICRKCGAGHGAQFVERWLKCDFKAAALEIEKHIGTARVVAPKTIQGEEGHKAAMSGLWRKGRPLTGEDLASRYLKARGIVLPSWPAALRFVEESAYRDEKTSTLVSYLPGMIANLSRARRFERDNLSELSSGARNPVSGRRKEVHGDAGPNTGWRRGAAWPGCRDNGSFDWYRNEPERGNHVFSAGMGDMYGWEPD